jgi:hypothetical protein
VTFTEWLRLPSTRVTNDSAGRLIAELRADACLPLGLPGPGATRAHLRAKGAGPERLEAVLVVWRRYKDYCNRRLQNRLIPTLTMIDRWLPIRGGRWT